MQASNFEQLSNKLQEKGHKLVAIQQNLVDIVWKNRPKLRLRPLEPLEQRFSGMKTCWNQKRWETIMSGKPELHISVSFSSFQFAGKRATDKLQAVRKELKSLGAESQIVTYLDSVACKPLQPLNFIS